MNTEWDRLGEWERLPDHVKRYLIDRMLSDIPVGVLETLAGLSEQEIQVLNKLGSSLEQAHAEPKQFAAIIH